MIKPNAEEFHIDSSRFDESDFVIHIRRKDEPVWREIPIGPVMTEREGKIVSRWLNEGGLAVLWLIAYNIMKGE